MKHRLVAFLPVTSGEGKNRSVVSFKLIKINWICSGFINTRGRKQRPEKRHKREKGKPKAQRAHARKRERERERRRLNKSSSILLFVLLFLKDKRFTRKEHTHTRTRARAKDKKKEREKIYTSLSYQSNGKCDRKIVREKEREEQVDDDEQTRLAKQWTRAHERTRGVVQIQSGREI